MDRNDYHGFNHGNQFIQTLYVVVSAGILVFCDVTAYLVGAAMDCDVN